MNEAAAPISPPPTPPRVQPLSASELLRVWERGRSASPVEQAISLLESACPSVTRESIEELSIGKRDTCLLELREILFGRELCSLTDCPGCGERLEMTFQISDIRVPPDPESRQRLTIRRSGYELGVRLPNSADLLALSTSASLQEICDKLFARCVVSVTRSGLRLEPVQSVEQIAASVPVEVVEAAIEAMGEADRQADVKLDLTCPICGIRWKTTFDIVSYLWSELQERAMCLMREVHLLASTYGWGEFEILALSSWRRQYYLEMLSG